MTAMIYDLGRARVAKLNGERNLRYPWRTHRGPVAIDTFRVGDTVTTGDGKTGTILCFGPGSTYGTPIALVTVNGMNYSCPISELRTAG